MAMTLANQDNQGPVLQNILHLQFKNVSLK